VKYDTAVSKLADDIRYAQYYAFSHHDTTWVVVDVSNNQYGIYVGYPSSSRVLIVDPYAHEQVLIDFDDEQYKGVGITNADFDGSEEFYFDHWGTPSTGGTVDFDNGKTITVTAGTGYVSVTD